MGSFAALALAGWLAQAPPPPPVVVVRPPRYGERGTSEVTGSLAFSWDGDIGFGLGVRRFIVDRLAPGIEFAYLHRDQFEQGWLMGSLKLVLIRGPIAFSLTARGGRLFFSDFPDGWAVGGGPSLQVPIGRHFAVDFGYEVYALFPDSFCDAVFDCWTERPYVGFLIRF
jgi:hypothetical protein